MDVSIFIRRRTVLVLWLVAPLLIAATVALGGLLARRGTYVSLERKKVLERVVPQMEAIMRRGMEFAEDKEICRSVQDAQESDFISMVNNMAYESGLQVSSITLEDEMFEKALNTRRIHLRVKAAAEYVNILRFFGALGAGDYVAYEESATIKSSAEHPELLYMELLLCRVVTGEFGRKP